MPEQSEKEETGIVNELLIKEAYRQGIKAGVAMYAWWKDGVQYVGTTGRSLKAAWEAIDKGDYYERIDVDDIK